jgi:hypothetical protein
MEINPSTTSLSASLSADDSPKFIHPEFDSAFTFVNESLSSLSPIQFTYKFNKEEHMAGTFRSFANGFSYYTHNALSAAQDVVFSKKNLIALTGKKSLYDVFDPDSEYLNLGTIAGSVFLKTQKGQYVTFLKDVVYVGGSNPLFITVSPLETSKNIVELIVDKDHKIIVDAEYPYTARISNDVLLEEELNRQRFEIDYADEKVCFKTMTKDGWRFLGYGADQTVRAIGLTLNEVIVSPYIFTMEFVSNKNILYNINAKTSEVKYFNELVTYLNRNTVTIKKEEISDTHLLLSCATSLLGSDEQKVPVNVSLTKTNFAATGTYLTKI